MIKYNMFSGIKRRIPDPLRVKLRNGYHRTLKPLLGLVQRGFHFISDKYEEISGKRSPLTPPTWMNFSGNGDFEKIGQLFLDYFINLANLKPDEKILDAGCGIGRMAVPLMSYLNNNGRYEGFDIIPSGIRWCQKHISTRAKNFHFRVADVYNYGYNPLGKYQASDFTFPYDNESFDFVFLISVFTHMKPGDMEQYLSETRRVLKRGSRCLITFFLINEESQYCIDQDLSSLDFTHRKEGYRINDPYIPEDAVAYDESYILDLYDKNQFKITRPLRYGSWCGRSEFLCYQDIILAERQ